MKEEELKDCIVCNVGYKKFAAYKKNVYLLTLNAVYTNKGGFIKGWQMWQNGQMIMDGRAQADLKMYFNYLEETLKLKDYSDAKQDRIIVYIDDVDKIKGFFYSLLTEEFSPYSVLINHIEFRTYESWVKESSPEELSKSIQSIVNNVFIPEKYFYLTPNQRSRKQLAKICKEQKNDIAKNVFPESVEDYKTLREALYGGICYCPLPGVIKEKRILGLDICSAYIYSMLTQKYPISAPKKEDPTRWEFYSNNPFEGSLGIYKIRYSTASNVLHCFKEYISDEKGANLVSGTNVEVILTLDNVDLNIFLNLPKVYILEVECLYLETYDLGPLPDYFKEFLIKEYLKKFNIDKQKNPVEYKLQKTILNGLYGNTIKKLNLNNYDSLKNKAYLAPQWGIWTTSHTKKHLLDLALQIEGWLYSDTDSIYCYDTYKNLSTIKHYNNKTRSIMEEFIEDYCFNVSDKDKEALLELGYFEIENKIKKFKALKQKEYLYTTMDDKIVVKAAGCNKEEMPLNDSLYKLDQLPVGTKTFTFTYEDAIEDDIDGEHYESPDGYYYESTIGGEAAKAVLEEIAKIKEGEN